MTARVEKEEEKKREKSQQHTPGVMLTLCVSVPGITFLLSCVFFLPSGQREANASTRGRLPGRR